MTRNPLVLPGTALLAILYSAPAIAHSSHLTITTLSAGPENVSGGDVLVRIDVPRNAAFSDVRVSLNGADVTGVFLPDGDSLIGLVTGLREGDNVLKAPRRSARGRR